MQADDLPNRHNVNIAQGFREPATYFMQSKDSNCLAATYNDFDLIRKLYGQVPGGMFGADENARKGYDDPRQAIETCGIVEQMSSDEILLGISGDPFWADNCENVAFNTYPAAVMPDFKALRYLTAPNMVLNDGENHNPGIDNSGPFLMMNPFSSRCCQHNHAQGWPYYAEHLWMATPDNGLAAVLYNSCVVSTKVGDGQSVTLSEDTHYPFDESIVITVNTSEPVVFPVYLRIPAWCGDAAVSINGKALSHKHKAGTYTRIENNWYDGDIIKIEFPMRINIKKWNKNKNSVSVNYGPLTFSLKINEDYIKANSAKSALHDSDWQETIDTTSWPSYEIHPASAWNYGLTQEALESRSKFEVVKGNWPSDNFPFTQQAVPIYIKTKGRQISEWGIDKYGLCDTLPPSPVKVESPAEDIILIPMGAARLRISSFPVVE